jgi:DNA-binding NarL/FixJ family response regulator
MSLLAEAPASAPAAEDAPDRPDRPARNVTTATAMAPAPGPPAPAPDRARPNPTRPDQSWPDQYRPDQNRPDQNRPKQPQPKQAPPPRVPSATVPAHGAPPPVLGARPAHAPSPAELGLRRILTVVDVLLGFTEENELLDHLLPALRRALPADSVLWSSTDRERASFLAEPAAAAPPELLAALETHADADPLMARLRRGAGTAVRRSDVQSDHEFRRLATFRTVFAALDARHQLAFAMRPSADRKVLILFNRATADFTHHDLAVAESLRPRIARALARFGPPGVRREEVSPREADVLDLLCRGLTDRQIATRLGISPRTVDKHLEHAYVKLGVRCRVQAAARWQS